MATQISSAQNNLLNANIETNSSQQALLSSINKSIENTKESAQVVEKIAATVEQETIEQKQASEIEQEKSEIKEEKELVEEALDVIADFMSFSLRNINFQQDDASDKTVIKFFDSESNELIKQFPTEEVLEIAQKIIALRQDVGEKTGIFLEEKV